MAKGKRKRVDPEVELARPWCYYCEKDFTDYQNLTNHMRQKHFACGFCNRRLNTVGGLRVHLEQVHKESLSIVENALPNRSSANGPEIFNMEGIPEDVVEQHRQRILAKIAEEYPNGFGSAKKGAGADKPHEPKIEVNAASLEEIKARAKATREKNKARREAIARGETVPDEPVKPDAAETNNAIESVGNLSHVESSGPPGAEAMTPFSTGPLVHSASPPGTSSIGHGPPGFQTHLGHSNPYAPHSPNFAQPFNAGGPLSTPYNSHPGQQPNAYGHPGPHYPNQNFQGPPPVPHRGLPTMPGMSPPPPQSASPGLPFAPSLPARPPPSTSPFGAPHMNQNIHSFQPPNGQPPPALHGAAHIDPGVHAPLPQPAPPTQDPRLVARSNIEQGGMHRAQSGQSNVNLATRPLNGSPGASGLAQSDVGQGNVDSAGVPITAESLAAKSTPNKDASAPGKISKKDKEKPKYTKLTYNADVLPEERRATIARYRFDRSSASQSG